MNSGFRAADWKQSQAFNKIVQNTSVRGNELEISSKMTQPTTAVAPSLASGVTGRKKNIQNRRKSPEVKPKGAYNRGGTSAVTHSGV